ncbi:MAG TPA: ATP-binding protein [Prolixibacteraceae bacterium]|jgi:PAS domain S-box-containing protein
MGRWKNVVNFIFAEDEDLLLEDRLFLNAVIIGILTASMGSAVNLLLNSSLPAVIVPLFLSAVLSILYYFVRVKKIIQPLIFPAIVISMLGISLIWIFNGGINGSNVMLGFVILILGLISVPDHRKKYVLIIFLGLFVSVYLIQFYRPELIINFYSEQDRWIDSIFSLLYSAYFIFLVIKFLHQNYSKQRFKSIESDEKFRFLTENSSDTIWHVDQNYCFDYVSPADERMRGFKKEEVIGASLWSLLKPEGIEYARKGNAKRIEDEQHGIKSGTICFELELKCKDGSWIWTEINSSPHYDHNGHMIGLHGVTRDITLRKKAAQEILLKNEELNNLVATKDKFFSIIAHDLRSPFTSFLGLTQIMANDLSNLTMTEIQDIAQSMSKSANNIHRLLENLLQWSHIQKGALPFHPQMVQLKGIVNESISMVMESARNKEIEITTHIPEGLSVFADSQILQSIFRNLAFNAVKFTHQGGKVMISAYETQDSQVEIAFQDTGIGMSPRMLDDLFRIDIKNNRAGTEGEPGTGLGLLLCKEFVRKHGGDIWVNSEVGKGTTFYFTIPCSDVPSPANHPLVELPLQV